MSQLPSVKNAQASQHQSHYQARMHRVLEHIDRHLDQPLDLEVLAGVAHFSPYHFHRLFAAWMGERLGDYVRRRRLEAAAFRLFAQAGTPVLEIALSVGFGSAEAFTRAFKDRFAYTPAAWRQYQIDLQRTNSKNNQAVSNNDQVQSYASFHNGVSSSLKQVASMDVKLIHREPVNIAYLRHIGPYGAEVGQFWAEVVSPWMATHNLFARARYGISHDDPSITDPALCRYDAAVELPENSPVPGNALLTSIPGGEYASLHFEGRSTEIGETWAALLRDWLPASGYQIDARPCFEYYSPEACFDPETGIFDCDICIPVIPL
ncbi:AraC family transcriptional regulator [Undibacterium sp. TC4M20W]|uniref:AraC family transcriptional regulator n=1 Tax=Undibacterium sp. TC4M20W TaxID=3413052 RepID=UPI003BF3FCB6